MQRPPIVHMITMNQKGELNFALFMLIDLMWQKRQGSQESRGDSEYG